MTYLIICASLLCFALETYSGGITSLLIPNQDMLITHGANFGVLVASGQYWRLLSNIFVHIGAIHLAMNMYVLYDIGRQVEKLFGSWRFLVIYLFSGLFGSLLSIFCNPLFISAGASGAILGLVGAFLAILSGNKNIFSPDQRSFHLKVMGAFVMLICIYGTFVPGVDNAAHFGGLAAGFVSGLCFLPGPTKQWRLRDTAILATLLAMLFTSAATIVSILPNDSRIVAYNLGEQGNKLLKQGNALGALAMFDRMIALDATNPPAYCWRAAALTNLKRYQQALADCSQALVLAPRYIPAHIMRASTYNKLGKEQEAVADLNIVIMRDPRSAVAYNSRAWSELALGNLPKAREDINKALHLDQTKSTVWDTSGTMYIYQKAPDKALSDLNKAISLKPKEGSAYFHRALAFQLLGDMQRSQQDAQTAASLGYEQEQWEQLPTAWSNVQHKADH